ncbi:GNAT family N-acetyltransferase, partial [Streptomyces prasinus]
MTELRIRAATPGDLDAVLAFWRTAAKGTSISDDRAGVDRLVARDPGARGRPREGAGAGGAPGA